MDDVEECDEEDEDEEEEEEVVWGPTNTEIENDEDGLEDLDVESGEDKAAAEENRETNGRSFSALRDEEEEEEQYEAADDDAVDKPESEANCLVEDDDDEAEELSSEDDSSESEGNQSDAELERKPLKSYIYKKNYFTSSKIIFL